MFYNWMAETQKVIDAILKAGLKYIYNKEDAYVFASTTDFKKLDKANIIVVRRKKLCTELKTSANFDEKIFKQIHDDSYWKHRGCGFFPNLTVVLQNKKTKKYKMLQLQPLTVMGMLLSLGVFDYSSSVKFPKIANSLSNEQKHKKIIEKMLKDGFQTETRMSADFDLFEGPRTIQEQIEEKFPPNQWEWIGPKKIYHKIELDFFDKWDGDIDKEKALEKILKTHLNQDVYEKDLFNFSLERKAKLRLLDYAKKIINSEKKKKTKTDDSKIIDDFCEKEEVIASALVKDEWLEEIKKLH